MKMTNSNKITNTKVGDDIHFYVNGSEDRGIVVKMNNDYVTVFKESTQEYDDIHINDTFFIKDILVNKEWDKMEDSERYEQLVKIHAPSPRYVMKRWNDLPKEIKELLTKNNAIETAHGEGKDDDMNNLTRLSGTVDENKSGDASWRSHSTGTKGKKIPKGQLGSKPKRGEAKPDGAIDAGDKAGGEPYQKNPEEITEHQAPERFRSIDNEKGEEKGTKNTEGINYMTEGGGGIGVFDKNPLGSGLKNDKARHKEKAWEQWLAKREEEVLKDTRDAGIKQKLRNVVTAPDVYPSEIKGLGEEKDKSWEDKLEVLKIKDVDTGLEVRDYDAYQHRLDSRESKKDPKQVKQDKADSDAFEKIAEKFVPKGSNKAWESWLEEQKSNTERSIHGNAGREPNSGVNTNTGFDAPKDYEGFSHSGVRPEQFKHERKKPKVTNKERINIGSTAPSRPSQGTGDGGNPHNTRQQNKDVKGRAVSGKDRK